MRNSALQPSGSRGRDVPDGVPSHVLAVVVEPVDVLLDPHRVHRELEGGAPVEVGVDDHAQQVGVRLLVAARQLARDLGRAGVVRPHEDVERRLPVENARLRPLRGRLALVGLELGEAGGDRSHGPEGLVHEAIHLDVRVGDPRRRKNRRVVAGAASGHNQGAPRRAPAALFLALHPGAEARERQHQPQSERHRSGDRPSARVRRSHGPRHRPHPHPHPRHPPHPARPPRPRRPPRRSVSPHRRPPPHRPAHRPHPPVHRRPPPVFPGVRAAVFRRSSPHGFRPPKLRGRRVAECSPVDNWCLVRHRSPHGFGRTKKDLNRPGQVRAGDPPTIRASPRRTMRGRRGEGAPASLPGPQPVLAKLPVQRRPVDFEAARRRGFVVGARGPGWVRPPAYGPPMRRGREGT